MNEKKIVKELERLTDCFVERSDGFPVSLGIPVFVRGKPVEYLQIPVIGYRTDENQDYFRVKLGSAQLEIPVQFRIRDLFNKSDKS